MSLAKRIREIVKVIALGRIRPPQKFFLEQNGAQKEITVWLHGLGEPRDVTSHHSLACAAPLTICIAFEKGTTLDSKALNRLTLNFFERDASRQLLGTIGLKYKSTITTTGPELFFFEVESAANYCLPFIHRWSFYLHHRFRLWRKPPDPRIIQMSFLGMRAMDVLFICPRPIGVASAAEGTRGNMFPLNVMGPLAEGYFGFALKDARFPSHLVERTGKIALTTVPMQHGDLAYKLGPNHSRNGLEWSDLPFDTVPSPKFHIPVPHFALRVREIEVELSRKLGTHIFFVGRIVNDQQFANAGELCVVHGHYQTWRLKSRQEPLAPSLAEDTRVKRGALPNNELI